MRNRGGFFRIKWVDVRSGFLFWYLLARAYDRLACLMAVLAALARSLEEAPDLAAGRSSACLNMSDTNRVEMPKWPGISGSPIY